MANGTLALPPWTCWVKRLAIAHTVGYIAWIVLGRWAGQPDIAREMVLVPASVHEGRAWQLVTYVLSNENPLSFVFHILALWMFGGPLEQRWGRRRFLGFYALCTIGSATLVTLLALALPALADFPNLGPGAAILGIIVAWGVAFAHTRIYFFGAFPMTGRTLLLLSLGMVALFALATTPLAFVIHAFAAMLAALHAMGWWRPARLLGSIRGAWLRWRARRARRHLRAIGDNNDRRYLH